MTRKRATASLVAKIKRAAQAASRQQSSTHSAALEIGAREAGYASWHELHNAAPSASTSSAPDLRLDPVLPAEFDNTPNEKRSTKQLAEWWDRPFAISRGDGMYEVRCLDGGAWDRSTWYGQVEGLEAAKRLAEEKLTEWRAMRSRPMALYEDEMVKVVRPPQHPHEDFTVLHECGSSAEANAFIAAR